MTTIVKETPSVKLKGFTTSGSNDFFDTFSEFTYEEKQVIDSFLQDIKENRRGDRAKIRKMLFL